jgi:hypothetical protein
MILKLKVKYLKMKDLFKHLKSNFKIYFLKFKIYFYFSGFIRNIAAKYGLEIPQITVSSVEEHGLTSFQIMPFFNENMQIFDSKMDQIDIDVMQNKTKNLSFLFLFYLVK